MRTRLVMLVLPTYLGACGPPEKPASDVKRIAPSAVDPLTAPPALDPAPPQRAGGFADQLEFLKRHAEVQVLSAAHGARVVVSAQYQGRVMTSAVNESGEGLGWINRAFIESAKTGTQFDNYGGEDRFWLGPEAGQYGLYFPQGKPFEFSHWQTPAEFQLGTWKIVEENAVSIAFEHEMTLANYSGASFRLGVKRRISLLAPGELSAHLGLALPEGVDWVAFQSENAIENRGEQAWRKETGLLSIWILAMFPPADDTWAILPYERSGAGPVVNDAYFGKVPTERLKIDEGQAAIFFRCDGQLRSKIGLSQARARSVLGSFSASKRLLTIVQYNLPQGPAPYVNSMWEQQKAPYRGDVVNSYNDGPTEPGKPALGGFYELETSSPGAELGPGASLSHTHRTFHFVGDRAQLETLARQVLGISLATLPGAQDL